MKSKQCSKCKEVKPVTEFYANKTTKDGYQSWCKTCSNNFKKAYHQTPKYRAYIKAYRQTAKRKVYIKAYRQTPEYKVRRKAYEQTPERRAYIKAYQQTPEYKAYKKAWRSSPEGKVKQKAYQKTPEYKAGQKAYRKAHKAEMRAYRQTPERRAYQKAHYQEHKAEMKDRAKAYKQTPDGKASDARSGNKRRTLMKELPCDLTAEQWEEIKKSQDYRCAICGKVKPLARDHIHPLSKGGAFTKSNIQGLCKSCNSSKSNKIISVSIGGRDDYSKSSKV